MTFTESDKVGAKGTLKDPPYRPRIISKAKWTPPRSKHMLRSKSSPTPFSTPQVTNTRVSISTNPCRALVASRCFSKDPQNKITTRVKLKYKPNSHHVTRTTKCPPNGSVENPRSKPITTVNNEPRTESFGAISVDNTIPNHTLSRPVKVHTLILGTHPSVKSLSEQKYFCHPMNAFWWIAGDCLGFRRAAGLSVKNTPYKFTSNLRYDESHILPYDEQVQKLTSKGFALWDIIKSCEREGSLDSAIKREEPNDIRAFCDDNPDIKRIVFANGMSACKMFSRHYREWWEEEGELMPERDEHSLKAFSEYKERKNGRIKCVAAHAVSPAAAGISYEEKRDNWEANCYRPGLEANLRLQQLHKESRILSIDFVEGIFSL